MDSSPDLAESAIHRFLTIYRYLRQHGRQMDDRGIRPRQFSVLRFLLEHGPATVGDVQSYLYTSASTASTVISQLEELGYVTRSRNEDDNRVVIVAITEAGHQIAEQTPLGGIALLRRRLHGLPASHLKILDQALAEIAALMEIPESE